MEDSFITIVIDHQAGDPMDEDVIWTYLSSTEISHRLAQFEIIVSPDTVRGMLDEYGFRERKAEKTKAMGNSPFRNEQFETIAQLKHEYFDSSNPIFSIDTKKKELLGEFARPGRAYSTGPNRVFDHDYPSYAEGKIIPHGIYDLKRNAGHVTLGTSHDTSQFACDSFRLFWCRHGASHYPQANSMLWLCDSGGSNHCRHHIFKEDLQRLVNRIGIPIRVAHYPTHCSKYNPIEHRFFSHITRAWSGVTFRTMDIVTKTLQRVWTSTGLKLTYTTLGKDYKLKRKASQRFLENIPIQFEDHLPNWNYTVVPTIY